MKINIKDLECIMGIITNSLEHRGEITITLSNEDLYYQKIWHEDRDFKNEPPITLDMIDEDMDELLRLLQGEALAYSDLERLGAILTVVGAVLVRK